MAIHFFVKQPGSYVAFGLSTDTKPASPPAGSMFVETDTGVSYAVEGGGAWVVTTPAPDIALSLMAPAIDETITAGHSAHVVDFYTIADQKFLEVGAGAAFEVG